MTDTLAPSAPRLAPLEMLYTPKDGFAVFMANVHGGGLPLSADQEPLYGC